MVSRKGRKKRGTVVEIRQAKSCQDQSPTDNFLADIRRILIAPEANLRLWDRDRGTKKFLLFFTTRFVKTNRIIPIAFLRVQRPPGDPDFAPSKIPREEDPSKRGGGSFQLIRSDNVGRATLNGRVTGILYPVFITFAVSKTIRSGMLYLVSRDRVCIRKLNVKESGLCANSILNMLLMNCIMRVICRSLHCASFCFFDLFIDRIQPYI